MITLFDKETGEEIGPITPEQLEFLMDHLEEESSDDTDYYLTEDTIDLFEIEGADEGLVEMLRNALGDRTEFEVQWVTTGAI
ncbi:hypothetical protein CCAX7_006350 [Capsulimonas corticalis]|uniref:Uncharacterized protein n=1 Tax=Capsulimonas corticalis TaxID=2219043 RepID=A0A402D3H6_9BACT|nr:galactosyldiacylglycerol synthase [Capsulimonas corticalis]BDI28584.1 hypothetical protein CCAX7_006350 [Capsulimonas corticalis]